MTSLRTIVATALVPCIWGSTFVVTTELLPDSGAFTNASIRALVAGFLLLLLTREFPRREWFLKIIIAGVLNFSILGPSAYVEKTSETPAGAVYRGCQLCDKVCGVSVLRAGDSMEAELRAVCPDAPIGKILIQRDKESHQPKFYFANLPDDIAERQVLLLDPMLATGGTAVEAISKLQMEGVRPENIVFITLLSVANGLSKVHAAFPDVRVVTSSIEKELNSSAYMLPGIGDFGDRYFGTYTIPQGDEKGGRANA